MPIDTSIYSIMKPIEIYTDGASQGLEGSMRIQQMAQQQKSAALQEKRLQREDAENDALKASFSKNIGEDGQINRSGLLSDLGRSNPKAMLQYQEHFRKQDADAIEQKSKEIDFHLNQLGSVANLAASATDQQTYDAALKHGSEIGLDVSKMPKTFDKNLVQSYRLNAYKQSDRLAAEKEKNDSILAKMKFQNETTNSNTDRTAKFRIERSNLPTTKATQDVSSAYNRIQEAAKTPSAAGDLSLIFGYMKMLDPGSTVREGEFANAQNAAGVPARLLNVYEKVRTGQRLGPEQRADFLNQAKGLYGAQISQQQKIDEHFARQSVKSGIDPRDVNINFEANEPEVYGPTPDVNGLAGKILPSANAGETKPKKTSDPIPRIGSIITLDDGLHYTLGTGGSLTPVSGKKK